mmetsp:Transcript_60235/g.95631  ORF Transcript_60235/g.95631 Transcript_60235/m.95631 type:complete len:205 (-) Transcript_60235:273-887(-)
MPLNETDLVSNLQRRGQTHVSVAIIDFDATVHRRRRQEFARTVPRTIYNRIAVVAQFAESRRRCRVSVVFSFLLLVAYLSVFLFLRRLICVLFVSSDHVDVCRGIILHYVPNITVFVLATRDHFVRSFGIECQTNDRLFVLHKLVDRIVLNLTCKLFLFFVVLLLFLVALLDCIGVEIDELFIVDIEQSAVFIKHHQIAIQILI